MMYLGDFRPGSSVYVKFSTNAAAGSRVAFSDALEAGDVRVYKNGSATERASTAGFTVTSAFDSLVGVHHVTLDLSDNTDAGFYAAGNEYQIVLYPDTETVDSLAVAAVLGHFSIDRQKTTVSVIGLAQAGAAGTVTLPSTASATDSFYNGQTVSVVAGTGVGQSRVISGYVGSTKVATIDPNWITNPDSTSMLEVTMTPGVPTTTVPQVDVKSISTSATAADNLELMFNGTGYAGGTTKLTVDAVSISGDTTAGTNLKAAYNGTGYIGGTLLQRVDARAFGGTTVTARDIGASVLLSPGTGTGQLSITSGVVSANATQIGGQTASAAGTVTFPGTIASTTNITAGTLTTVTNLTNAPTAGDFTATMKTSIGTAVAASAVASVTGNVGGNVTGSVGSVVGAVGSVTGNVGGNVTGSVGSITTGGITTASFAPGAIDAAAIATDAIGANEISAAAATKIGNASVESSITALLTYSRPTDTSGTITGPTSGSNALGIATDASYNPFKTL